MFVVIIFFVLLLLPADGSGVRWGRSIFFLVGALFSAVTGFVGMTLTIRGNLRVAAAAREGGERRAFRIGYRTGTITGMLTDGLGLLGGAICLIYMANAPRSCWASASAAPCWPCSCGSAAASTPRRPTSAPTWWARSRQDIPEDDPRNAATIADNVGDNVGDCAGMAADIFESYEVTIVAAMILGYASFGHKGVIFPLLVRAIGVVGSIISTYSGLPRRGRQQRDDRDQPRLLHLRDHLGHRRGHRLLHLPAGALLQLQGRHRPGHRGLQRQPALDRASARS